MSIFQRRFANGLEITLDHDDHLDRVNSSAVLADTGGGDLLTTPLIVTNALIEAVRGQRDAGDIADRLRDELTHVRRECASIETARQSMAAEVEQLRGRLAAIEVWKTKLTEDAHRYADDADWCSQFDDFMEEHGLRRRTRKYRATFAITYVGYMTVEASSSDEADTYARARLNDSTEFPNSITVGEHSTRLHEETRDINDIEAV